MRKVTLILGLFCMALTANKTQAQKAVSVDADATASYVAPNFISNNKKKEFQLSTGAFFFDATKRMGVFNVIRNDDGSFQFKYLGEEQPDAVYETVKKFLADAAVNVSGKLTVDASVSSLVEKLVQQLTNKSNALNFLRTSLYRLNESAYNNDIEAEAYAELYKIIIEATAQLQKLEFETNPENIITPDNTEEEIVVVIEENEEGN